MRPLLLILVLVAVVSAFLNGFAGVGGSVVFETAIIAWSPFGASSVMGAASGLTVFLSLACTLSAGSYYMRNHLFDKPSVFYLGFTGFAGALVGSLFASHVAGGSLQILFFLLTIVSSFVVLFRPTGRSRAIMPLYGLAVAGGIIGLIGGLFGIGANFLTVPLLISLRGMDIKSAIGTALGGGILIIIGAALGRVGGPFLSAHPLPIAIVAGSGLLGALAGSAVTLRASPRVVQVAVSLMLMAISLKYILAMVA